jgi:uncharacterized caspase-like protein
MKRAFLFIGVLLLSAGYLVPYRAFSDALIEGVEIGRARVPSVRLLSVGVGKYSSNALPELKTPATDAQLLSSTFSSMEGRVTLKSAKVILDEDATKSGILVAYRTLISQSGPDDLAVFFFTGHSVQDRAHSKIYLMPSDMGVPSDPQFSAEQGVDLQRDIIQSTPPDRKVLIIVDGCHIGDGSLGPLMDLHPELAILASSKADELAFESDKLSSTPFVSAMTDVLKNPKSDLDGDQQLSVEELYIQLYVRMVQVNIGFYGQQHPSLIGLRSHRLMLATASKIEAPAATMAERLELPESFAPTEKVSVNGNSLIEQDQYQIADGKLTFLGSGADLINAGINVLTIGRQQFYLWKVGASLKAFRNPYQNSRAIIVAIDDYDRKKDPLKRGPTGFSKLTGMVDNAKKLKSVLVSLGFPEEGIIELYDDDATSKKLGDTLESFWTGGANASADRLFVYFGGHGDNFQSNNLLVSYDYEESKRLMTTFQAKDLVERHSRNIQAKHVLFAIDVCYAGLVFLGPDDLKNENQELAENERLALIERDVKDRARNIITAGRGDQRALSEGGGIFTKALIEGLQGKADRANSGVIEFDQLGLYVRDRVTVIARFSGYNQVPEYSNLKDFGEGRMMFIRPMSKN